MQRLTLAMLVVVTTFEFLVRGDRWGRWAILPDGAQYLPEISSMIAVVLVLVAGTRNRFQYVRAQYWILFGALLLTMACGVVVNHVGAGPVFAGLRNFLRAMPWFFIPAVFAFTDQQIKSQLKVLLGISLLQLPLAAQQRLATSAQGSFTGDFTSGSLLISSIMSIFLIGTMCVVAAMYARGQVKRWQFAVLFVLLLVPTTLNETKATVFLLPLSLLVAFLVAARPGRRLRVVLLLSLMVTAFGTVYFPVYEHFNASRKYGKPLSELLTDSENLQSYVSKTKDIGADRPPGRMDSIVVPLKRLSADPPRLAFGLGIGNVSNSALGRGFTGEYFATYGPFLITGTGWFLLELGVIGTILIAAVMWAVFRDCLIVASRPGEVLPPLAAGWAGVTVLIVLGMFYKDLIVHASLSFVFWYFAGLIAAARMRGPASIHA